MLHIRSHRTRRPQQRINSCCSMGSAAIPRGRNGTRRNCIRYHAHRQRIREGNAVKHEVLYKLKGLAAVDFQCKLSAAGERRGATRIRIVVKTTTATTTMGCTRARNTQRKESTTSDYMAQQGTLHSHLLVATSSSSFGRVGWPAPLALPLCRRISAPNLAAARPYEF